MFGLRSFAAEVSMETSGVYRGSVFAEASLSDFLDLLQFATACKPVPYPDLRAGRMY